MRCTKCGHDKPTTEYHKHAARSTGLAAWCKACCADNMQKQYEKKRDERIAYATERNRANPNRSEIARRVMQTEEIMPDELLNYSPDNWAHKALILMDEANALVNWGAVSHPNTDKYKTAAKAFWDVCHLLAQERTRLHNAEVTGRASAACEGPR